MIFGDRELKTLKSTFTRMCNLELRKRLEPKFTKALKGLAEVLNLGATLESLEEVSEEDVEASSKLLVK